MEKSLFRVLIKHYFLIGKNTVQAKQWLDKCYLDTAPSRQMVEKCFADFKRGRTNTDNAERSGRPNSAIVPENIKNVHKMVLVDRKLKLREIADILKISEGSIFTILHEHLSIIKALFQIGTTFFMRCVTMDETWIHHYIPQSNQHLAEWTGKGENCLKRPKPQMSAGKILAPVFWDAHGILFIDYLKKERTINSEHNMPLLVRLKEEIAKNDPK